MSSNTNLGPTPVNQGYVQLIHIGETGGIDGTLRTIYDGDGTASDLQIASNAVKISTQLYIGSDTIQEYIQDVVGTMFTTGSYTNISTNYDDINGNIDLNATGAISSIIGGTGINATGSGDITIAIDSSVVTLTGSQTLTNKTLTSPTINAPTINTSLTFDSVALTAIQTSLEAFADNNTSIMTSAAIDDRILSYGYSTTTGTVTSVSGGNGLTGTITSSGSLNVGAGTHITVNADDVAVNTTTLFASPAFTGTATGVNLTLSGDLTVNGTTTTLDTTNLKVTDNIIELNQGVASNSNDSGIIIERGSTGDNAMIIWDESQDRWVLGTTTATADATGDITYTEGSVQATTFYGSLSGNASTATKLGTARNIAGVAFDGSASIDIPIGNLSDVTITSPSANQALIYNFGTGIWENGSAGLTYNGSTANGVLTYGSSTTIDVEQYLTFDGNHLDIANGHLVLPYGEINDAGTDLNIVGTNAVTLQSSAGTALTIPAASTNVGIGTTSPGTKLEVKANGDTSQEVIKIRNSSGTEIMTIAAIDSNGDGYINFNSSPGTINTNGGDLILSPGGSGNVGIGQASPGYKLTVEGDVNINQGSYYRVGGRVVLNGDSNYHTFLRPNAVVGIYLGGASDSRNYYDNNNHRFRTAGGAANLGEWNSTGLGIGVTSPTEKLHINSNVSYDTKIRLGDNGTSRYFLAGMFDSNTGMIGYVNGSPSHLAFHTGTGATGSEKMRIETGGNVGIGTVSPSNKLEAYGTDAGLVVHYQSNSRGGIHALSTQRIALATTASADDIVFGYGSSPVTSAGFVERMRIDNSTGNVGIGTTSPTNAKLVVSSTDSNKISIDGGSSQNGMRWEGVGGANTFYLFNGTFGTAGFGLYNVTTANAPLWIQNGGNVGIGTTSPSQKLHTNGTAADTRTRTSTSNHGTYFESGVTADSAGILLVAGHASSILNIYLQGAGGTQNQFRFTHNGDFLADEDIVAYSTSVGSDIKLKKNIKDISYGLNDVLKMRAVEFDWKEKRQGKHDIGFIAQEIEKIIPEVVQEVNTLKTDGDTHKVVDYAKITSVLIKAIQEQQQQINELKEKLNG